MLAMAGLALQVKTGSLLSRASPLEHLSAAWSPIFQRKAFKLLHLRPLSRSLSAWCYTPVVTPLSSSFHSCDSRWQTNMQSSTLHLSSLSFYGPTSGISEQLTWNFTLGTALHLEQLNTIQNGLNPKVSHKMKRNQVTQEKSILITHTFS